jgi:hypothetical protein
MRDSLAMKTNFCMIVGLVFLTTACGGNKAGTLTLRGDGVSPVSAPITAGPTTTPTATPAGGTTPSPNPSATPNPSSTPTGGTTPTPVPTPGDWNNAGNLPQAIFDIVASEPTPNHLSYQISYYDIDHLGPNPAAFSKRVNLSFVNTSTAQTSAQFTLTPSTPEFTNSSIECVNGCESGTIHLTYAGIPGSKLNGTADIDFFRQDIQTIKYQLSLEVPSDPVLFNFMDNLKNSRFLNGILTVFNVRNGFAQPYEVNLNFGLPGNGLFSGNSLLHGRKFGTSVEVVYGFHATLVNLNGSLGLAKASTDFLSNVELCLHLPGSITSFGAYTTAHPNSSPSCMP